MYTGPDTDCSPFLNFNESILQPYQQAVEIGSENTVGVAIMNEAVLFARNGEYIEKHLEVTLPQDTKRCLVCGLKEGLWQSGDGAYYKVCPKDHCLEIKTQNSISLTYLKE